LSAVLQLIETTHGGDDSLLAAAFFPAVLHDLQINVVSGSFLAEEHGGLPAGSVIATMRITYSPFACQHNTIMRGTMFPRRFAVTGMSALWHDMG
jgi:hypothetical protein